MKKDDLTRRDFLAWLYRGLVALSAILGLDVLGRFLSYQPADQKVDRWDVGPAENFPPGSQTVLTDPPAVLWHTAEGFKALSLVCTHLGCTVAPEAEEFACPCHGSRFDVDGDVLHGPASRRLESFQVEVDAFGKVILYRAAG